MSSDLWVPSTLEEYLELDRWLLGVRQTSVSAWEEAMRWYSINDLFFFVNRVLPFKNEIHSEYGKPLFFHEEHLKLAKWTDWAMRENKSTIDISGRRSGKTSIRTHAAAIQMALKYPDISIVIFSVERKLARAHLRKIKEILETSKELRVLFSDRLWEDPIDSSKSGDAVWSIDDGLRLRRPIPKSTQTIQQYAYFGGAPTGTGFQVAMYDDMEDMSVLGTQDMIEKLHESFASSLNLLTPSIEVPMPFAQVSNTIYHPNGVANMLLEKWQKEDPRRVRVRPGEDLSKEGDGPMGGVAVYPFTTALLKERYDLMTLKAGGKSEYAAQMCCSFLAGEDRTFDPNKIQWSLEDPRQMVRNKTVYICIDTSKGIIDPTGIFVWALGPDKRKYWVGGTRRKMDPSKPEFTDEIFNTVMLWSNLSERVVEIRVEELHQMAWSSLISAELRARGCYVPVIPCATKVRKTGKFANAKQEREWACWAPPLEAGELVFPRSKRDGGYGIKYTTDKGNKEDLVEYFMDYEFGKFPKSAHDDLLDAGALLWDSDANEERPLQYPSMGYSKLYGRSKNPAKLHNGWMSSGL